MTTNGFLGLLVGALVLIAVALFGVAQGIGRIAERQPGRFAPMASGLILDTQTGIACQPQQLPNTGEKDDGPVPGRC